MPHKVIVGLSGGVDSSVSALLLQQQGFDVTAVFMKNWEEDDHETFCAAQEDIKDVESIGRSLDISVRKINFSAEYWDSVFTHFLAEYQKGRTPNPDILCNQEIKFKAFLDYAKSLGGQFIAMGHYARKQQLKNGEYQLLKASDRNKDQSYFLYTLGQAQLKYTLFPIGELHKSAVRALAEKHHLVTHNKRDSVGICFIGERPFRAFLKQYLPPKPGDIEDEKGLVIGQHEGLMYYTLGQRQGLNIGGVKNRPEMPWFVAGKDFERNRLKVVQGHDHPLLFASKLTAEKLSWVSGSAPGADFQCMAKIRYRQKEQACHVSLNTEAAYVTFQQPQWAITPGQSVVFYQGEVCLGGGVID